LDSGPSMALSPCGRLPASKTAILPFYKGGDVLFPPPPHSISRHPPDDLSVGTVRPRNTPRDFLQDNTSTAFSIRKCANLFALTVTTGMLSTAVGEYFRSLYQHKKRGRQIAFLSFITQKRDRSVTANGPTILTPCAMLLYCKGEYPGWSSAAFASASACAGTGGSAA
jgi:hypothetical protein